MSQGWPQVRLSLPLDTGLVREARVRGGRWRRPGLGAEAQLEFVREAGVVSGGRGRGEGC